METIRSKIWKCGHDIIVLSQVDAVIGFGKHELSVYLKSGVAIKMVWTSSPETRDAMHKSLSDALEMYYLETA